eukprot:gene9658-11840_t
MTFQDFINNQIHGRSTRLIQRSVFLASSFDDLGNNTIAKTNSNASGNIISAGNHKNPPL